MIAEQDASPSPTDSLPNSAAESLSDTATRLLALLKELVRETHPSGGIADHLDLDSHLDRDLAMDSLTRTELLRRVEHTFQIVLGERLLLAETPRDLVKLIHQAEGEPSAQELQDKSLDFEAAHQKTPRWSNAGATPERVTTFIELLDWRAQACPDQIAIQIQDSNEQIEASFTYADLQQGAQAIAVGLRQRGLQPRQTAAIMLPTGSDYFLSFFGVLLAGGVPVPIYPPARPTQIEEHLRRHVRLLNNAQSVVLVTVPEAKLVARLLQTQLQDLRHVVTVAELQQSQDGWTAPPVHTDDLAFLQYTSGSTGDPKGVMLSHANLLANVRAMGRHIAVSPDDLFVSWLPLYHDMGLIGACLGSLYHGCPLVVMSPLTFLARPAHWLRAIHRHRATLSAAPNFAYELCARAIEAHDIAGLDLSSWRMAFNGAEPVNPATIERFTARFAPYGFRPEAMAPVYGLAECSVGLALQPPGRGPVIDRVRRDALLVDGRAEPAAPDDAFALQFPACGQPLAGHQIRIVDEHGRELPDRCEGQLEFKGPSATTGYYRNPEATRKLFPHSDGWLDSGDRAYMMGGDVYLTGRVKDLIIRGGRNLYPYELEQAVGDLAGIRKGCVAAFASHDPQAGSERLIVVAETRLHQADQLAELRQKIQSVSIEVLGIPPDDVALVPPHTVLKTSSGKIRRSGVRELYECNALQRGHRAFWLQLARVVASSAWIQVRRFVHDAGAYLYAAYVWLLFGLLAPVTWLGIMILPKREWCWAFSRFASLTLARLAGIPLAVSGLAHLPAGPCILIANHASYLDAYILIAAIPRPFHYVAKRELLNNSWLAQPLRRLGTLFVERFDAQRSALEGLRVAEAAKEGKSLAFFPEGTFTRIPGLRDFRMGAFVAAAQADVPVVPVSIRGARSMLRAGSWFPRRNTLEVIVQPPVYPEGQDWQSVVKLRDTARASVLRHCSEPDGLEDRALICQLKNTVS